MRKIPLITFFTGLFCFFQVQAQTGFCPPNLDFENGDFTNWVCRTGTAFLGGVNWTGMGQVNGRHTIIRRSTSGTDFYGGFPESCPNGSTYSVKLGNTSTGAQAEGIAYTYDIPATATQFSIFYQYAVVFQNPSHSADEQPRFRARITDLTTNAPIPCVTFDFTASSSLPGFRPSPNDPSVLFKGWTPVTLNLGGYAGRTIELEFITSDCTRGGHFGYAYVDVNSVCNGVVDGTTLCIGDTTATLTAPFGFQGYQWYADNTFTSLLSTNQSLFLNPPPTVGSVFPVVVTPFPGFGCRDTLFATIGITAPPLSVAGPDQDICLGQQVRLGSGPTTGYTYNWTPSMLVSDPTASNPMAWTNSTGPTEFIVMTTDLLTGCKSYDTVVLTGRAIDTTITLTGNATYCSDDPDPGSLTVSPTVQAVQWYQDNQPIPGATGFSYQPLSSGPYWAQVQQQGCYDSTAVISFQINPAPLSDAGPDQIICSNQPVQLGAAPNPAWNYSWTPAAQVSDPSLANPLAWVNGTAPETFIVEVTDALSGCRSSDTVILTGIVLDTAVRLTGKRNYCAGDAQAGVLQVANSFSSVQWYNGAIPVPGATGFSYQPTATGDYWAQVQQSGCTDSTSVLNFRVNAHPQAAFTVNRDTACLTSHSFSLTNSTLISDGSALTYSWRFSDGTTQNGTDAVKTFSFAGTYTVQLLAQSSFGCADSTGFTSLYVLPNASASFTWDSICVDRPVLFRNLSQENGSPRINYNWNFNNGGPASTLKNPLPVSYTDAGLRNVTLTATALGCTDHPAVFTRTVQVNEPKPGVRYRDITVPQGNKKFIQARDSVGKIYQWQPLVQLSQYTSRFTEFTALEDVLYRIVITDPHTCITTDTLQMRVLKKPGYYLPSAFTPNGDGRNDLVRPYLVGMQSLKSFSIFNRWGNLIFQTRKEGEGWDGRYQGMVQDPGVYIWLLEFYDNAGKLITEKGTITLIR